MGNLEVAFSNKICLCKELISKVLFCSEKKRRLFEKNWRFFGKRRRFFVRRRRFFRAYQKTKNLCFESVGCFEMSGSGVAKNVG